jgi:hypothetical protein
MCVCVCARARARALLCRNTHTHTHIVAPRSSCYRLQARIHVLILYLLRVYLSVYVGAKVWCMCIKLYSCAHEYRKFKREMRNSQRGFTCNIKSCRIACLWAVWILLQAVTIGMVYSTKRARMTLLSTPGLAWHTLSYLSLLNKVCKAFYAECDREERKKVGKNVCLVCSDQPTARRLDSSVLIFSLSSHRYSYISLLFSSRFIASRFIMIKSKGIGSFWLVLVVIFMNFSHGSTFFISLYISFA